MASPKALFLLFGVVFALLLLISSEASASADEIKKSMEAVKGAEEAAKYQGGPGNGYQGGYGGGYQGGYGGGSEHGHGQGGCRYGCCHGCCRSYRYGSGCKRCCANANEAPDGEFEDDIKN